MRSSGSYLDRPLDPRDSVEVLDWSLGESGAGILRDKKTLLSIDGTPQEVQVWRRLSSTGATTVRQALLGALSLSPPVDPSTTARALSRFGELGWLGERWRETRPRGLLLSLGRVQGTATRKLALAVFLCALSALAVGSYPLLAAVRDTGGLALIPRGGSAFALLLMFLALTSAREASRALAAVMCGLPIEHWGIRLYPGVPGLHALISDLSAGPRWARICVSLAGLLAPMSCLGLLNMASPALEAFSETGLLRQSATLVVLIELILLAPFLDLDGSHFYEAWLRVPGLREKSLAYLGRHLLASVIRPVRHTAYPDAILLHGGLMLVWCLGLMRVASDVLTGTLIGWGGEMARGQASLEVSLALICVFLFAGLGLIYVFYRLLTSPLGLLDPATVRRFGLTMPFPASLFVGALWMMSARMDVVAMVLPLLGCWTALQLARAERDLRGSALGGAFGTLFVGVLAATVRHGIPTAQAIALLPPSSETLSMLWNGACALEGACIMATAWWLLVHARRLTRPGEFKVSVASFGLWITVLLAFRLGLSSDFGPQHIFPGMIWGGLALSALALVPVLSSSLDEAFLSTSRSLILAVTLWFFVATLDLNSPAGMGPLLIEGALLVWVCLIFSGASISARLAVRGPLPVLASGPRHPPSEESEALVSAARLYFEGTVRLIGQHLGTRFQASLEREFNKGTVWKAARKLHLDSGTLGPATWHDDDEGDLREVLSEGVDRLDAAVTQLGGAPLVRRLRGRVLRSLFRLEWEMARRHLTGRLGGDEMPASGQIQDDLSHIPLFSNLSPSIGEALAARMRVERHPAGTRIVSQGEEGDIFYVVQHGELSVLHEGADGEEQFVAKLLSGDCFGETALLDGGIRTASVVASTEVQLLSLSREDFEFLRKEAEQVHLPLSALIRFGGFLAQVPPFTCLPMSTVASLAGQVTERVLEPGEVILEQGEPPSHLVIVKEGDLALETSEAPSGEGAPEGDLPTLGTGQVLGLEVFLESAPMPARGRAGSASARVLLLSREDLHGRMESYLSSYEDLKELAHTGAGLAVST